MTAHPTRRAILSAGALATAGMLPTASSAEPNPAYDELRAELAQADADRKAAVVAFRGARKRIARWGVTHPRPDYSGDGRALLAWLESYREVIVGSAAPARHREHAAAHERQAAVARRAAALPIANAADVKALARLAEHDCDGIIRAAVLPSLQAL